MHKNNLAVFTFALGLIPSELQASDFSNQSSSGLWWFLTASIIAVTAVAAFWFWNKERSREIAAADDPFSEQRITQTFISALPTITPELNLEIAKSWQMETVERTDTRTFLGISLGTNEATIRAGVTYRYHIRLRDPWQLARNRNAILVRAPMIRASQPPAIHSDQMEMQSKRGWGRTSCDDLAEQLRRDLTPTLCIYAEDPRRVAFVRETARHSVAEFVRLWLEKENRWNKGKFTSIHVCFSDEKTMPAQPALQLTEPTNVQLH